MIAVIAVVVQKMMERGRYCKRRDSQKQQHQQTSEC
jgi:hypothetical protein